MNYEQIKEICRKGKEAIVPNWRGKLVWDYGLDQLKFVNGLYTMGQDELDNIIANRDDLYYII